MEFSPRIRFLLLVLVVLPQFGRAQATSDGGFQAGSYVLRDVPGFRQQGQLKLQSSTRLLVRHADGKSFKFSPDQVAGFSIGQRQYVVARNFYVVFNSRPVEETAAFAELFDSGQVVLLRYSKLLNTGADWLYLYRYPISFYLIGSQSDSALTVVTDTFDQELVREKVRPFFKSRPDLTQWLDSGQFTYQDLPAAIHALNINSPHTRPLLLKK